MLHAGQQEVALIKLTLLLMFFHRYFLIYWRISKRKGMDVEKRTVL